MSDAEQLKIQRDNALSLDRLARAMEKIALAVTTMADTGRANADNAKDALERMTAAMGLDTMPSIRASANPTTRKSARKPARKAGRE